MKGVTVITDPDEIDNLDPEVRDELKILRGRIAVICMRGHFSFASARELNRRVGRASLGYEALIYDFTGVSYLDTSAAIALEELLTNAVNDQIPCFIAGFSKSTRATAKSLGVLEGIPPAQITETLLDSIQMAERILVDR